MSQNETFQRRTFVVDWRLQATITVQLLGVLVGVGLLYTLAVMVLPGSERLQEMDGEEVRQTLLRANAVYFALGAAILGVIALLLTHRIAGPALVLKRAVDGMREGKYDHRLNLRRRDYLKDVAASLQGLAGDLKQRDQSMADLAACLDENDVTGAKEIVAKLRGATAQPEPEPEPEPVKVVETEAETATKA
jgi:HAMP domain-containing protein